MAVLQIPIATILLLFLSKEVFSHDSEKVVILCISTFIIVTYFSFKDEIANICISISENLEIEYRDLIISKQNIEKKIYNTIIFFFNLELNVIKFYFFFKNNFISYVKKANNIRKFIIFHSVKDYLNVWIKNQFKINKNLTTYLVENSISNFKLNFYNLLDTLYFDLHKLKTNTVKYYINHLILNKLNFQTQSNLNNTYYESILMLMLLGD